VNPKPKLVEDKATDADFIDEIASLLPAEQRPHWFRDMAHLRRLPADDEMLRIARAMGFLAIVTRQTPAQIARERAELATLLGQSVTAIQSVRQGIMSLHKELDARLTKLPSAVAEGINPEAMAGRLGETLRQQFVQSGIPETAQALTTVAKQTKQVAAEFDLSSKQLTDSYRGAAKDARIALDQISGSIEQATATAKRAANDLTRTFLREYQWSVLLLCSAALALGFALGILYYRWMNPSDSNPVPNAVVLPSNPRLDTPKTPTSHPARKEHHKPASPNQVTQ
jgi:hypothetical protein